MPSSDIPYLGPDSGEANLLRQMLWEKFQLYGTLCTYRSFDKQNTSTDTFFKEAPVADRVHTEVETRLIFPEKINKKLTYKQLGRDIEKDSHQVVAHVYIADWEGDTRPKAGDVVIVHRETQNFSYEVIDETPREYTPQYDLYREIILTPLREALD